jgi:hypothetical protein
MELHVSLWRVAGLRVSVAQKHPAARHLDWVCFELWAQLWPASIQFSVVIPPESCRRVERQGIMPVPMVVTALVSLMVLKLHRDVRYWVHRTVRLYDGARKQRDPASRRWLLNDTV